MSEWKLFQSKIFEEVMEHFSLINLLRTDDDYNFLKSN